MDDFLPSLLADLIGDARQDAKAVFDVIEATPAGGFVDTSGIVAASAEVRLDQERARRGRFALMFETLTDKYDNAVRTDALLRKVAAGDQGFVLFLRGFSTKQRFEPDITVRHEQDLGEERSRFDLAKALSPLPMVMVRNPATSESLVNVSANLFEGDAEAMENTFAIDLDDGWQRTVEALVGAASAIVVRNKLPGEGLDAEIAMVARLGRLDDTYFSDPIDATQLGGGAPQAFDGDCIARLRAAARCPHATDVDLPSPPTCLWEQGETRRLEGDNVFFVFDYLNSLADRGQPMPRDMQGRLLFWATAASIGLERLDLMIMTLSSYANVISMYRPEELPEPESILKNYGTILSAVARAIDAEGSAGVLDFRDPARLRGLMRGEDPAMLLRTNLEVIAGMPMRLARQH